MSATIRALKARKADAHKQASTLLDSAAALGRDLSADEQTAFDAHKASMTSLNAQIERAEFMANESAGLDDAGAVVIPANSTIKVTENVANDPKRGFASFGEFAKSVRAGQFDMARADKRLLIGAAAPTTFGSEGIGQDGGFLIPPDFSKDIFQLSLMDAALLPMTDNTETTANSMIFPKDETTPWGTDGVRAYWQAEATAATATKPKFGTSVMQLHKLMALVPLTNELMDDTSALNSYLPRLVARSILWKTNEAILNGDGAGRPQGALVGACTIVVAKDTSQATKTVSTTNILNMIARLPPGSFPNSTWMITPDALPALFGLTLGNYPIYLPTASGSKGGIQLDPYGTLMGRPIMVSQHVPAFSSQGDISLLDLSYYRTLTKSNGLVTATSMHLYFDADALAFRTTFRMDGQPKIIAPIAQAKAGANTLSPFVVLAAR